MEAVTSNQKCGVDEEIWIEIDQRQTRIKVSSESASEECKRKQGTWVSVARNMSTSKMGGVGIAPQGARGVCFGWWKPRPRLIRRSGYWGGVEILLAEGYGGPVHWLLNSKA
jgi:hypothetical protein